MNHTIIGNILDQKPAIICHQVNCRRVAGSGLAFQIRDKWPDWYDDYRDQPGVLGAVTIFKPKAEVWVANLYAQDDFGRNKRHTDYDALRKCLKEVERLAFRRFGGLIPVYLPHHIGCGRAGGDWEIVSTMIEINLPEAIIVKLK